MNRYVRSPSKTFTAKPQILGNCNFFESEKTYIQNLMQKYYKYPSSSEDQQTMQRQISHELCKKFKKSVGVSVVEGDENYLQKTLFSLKEPNATVTYNGLLMRIWIKQDEIEPEVNHFERTDK